jgi:hypothetical protein
MRSGRVIDRLLADRRIEPGAESGDVEQVAPDSDLAWQIR